MLHIFDHSFFGENRDQKCSQYSRGEQTRNLYSSFFSFLINSYLSICFLDCCSAMTWRFHQISCYNPGSFSCEVTVSSEPITVCMMLGVLPLRLITNIYLCWISSVILSPSVLRSFCGLLPSAFPSSWESLATLATSPLAPTSTPLMKMLSRTDPCRDLHQTPLDNPPLWRLTTPVRTLWFLSLNNLIFHGSLLTSRAFDEGFCQSL